ncbi:MAG: hypothetical protein ABEH43_00125, partial [Flavobacteriales bacterium]
MAFKKILLYILLLPFLFIPSIIKGQITCPECIEINEFHVSPDEGPDGDDTNTGEFIELFNKCDQDVDIGCMSMCAVTGNYCGECVTIPSGTVLGAGDVFVMGGNGTNCSGGGVTSCDYPNLTLDLNWHDCGCVNDPDAGESCSSSNGGNFWGVLVNDGEDIHLYGAEGGAPIQSLHYCNGGDFQSGDCSSGGSLNLNGCNSCSNVTVDVPNTSSTTDIGGSCMGNPVHTGFTTDCSGGYNGVTDSTGLSPGKADCSSLITPPCLCPADATFSINDTGQCLDSESFDFTNQGSSGGSWSSQWDFTSDGTFDASGDNITGHTFGSAGTYVVSHVVDSSGCRDSTTITVTVGDATANIATPPDTITCSNLSVNLDASSSTSTPGSPTFSWNALSGNITSGSNDDTATVDQSGDYEVVVTDDSLGCTDKDTVTVVSDSAMPTANITGQDTITCTKQTDTLDGTGSTTNSGNINYSW